MDAPRGRMSRPTRLAAMLLFIVPALLLAPVALPKFPVAHGAEWTPHPHRGVLDRPRPGRPRLKLSEGDLDVIDGGHLWVQTKEENDVGIGMAVSDIAAPPDVVYDQVSDVRHYVGKVPYLREVNMYKTWKFGTMNVAKAEYVVASPIPGLGYRYYVTHHAHRYRRALIFHLDYDRKSDVDDMQGKWYVEAHPSRPGWSRVYYQCDVKLPGYYPSFVKLWLTKRGLVSAVGWVTRESEHAAALQAETATESTTDPSAAQEPARKGFAGIPWLGGKKETFGVPLEEPAGEIAGEPEEAGQGAEAAGSEPGDTAAEEPRRKGIGVMRFFQQRRNNDEAPVVADGEPETEVEGVEATGDETPAGAEDSNLKAHAVLSAHQRFLDVEPTTGESEGRRWDGGWYTRVNEAHLLEIRNDLNEMPIEELAMIELPDDDDGGVELWDGLQRLGSVPEFRNPSAPNAFVATAELVLVAPTDWLVGALLVAAGMGIAGYAACRSTAPAGQLPSVQRPWLGTPAMSSGGSSRDAEPVGVELRTSMPAASP